jgi:protein-L-isoaspartate(D-aspartate) O-methyltransferase
MRCLTRSVAFDREGTGLVSRSYRLCGFVPAQGDGAHEQQVLSLGDGTGLRVDDDAPDLDLEALRDAASQPGTQTWPGIAYDLPDELELFLMTATRHTVMLHATRARVERGDFAASAGRGVPALIRGGSFAYRARRRLGGGEGRLESGVVAHGPDAASLTEEYTALLRRWAEDYRYRGAASIRYVPASAGAPQRGEGLIAKRHGSVVVDWL